MPAATWAAWRPPPVASGAVKCASSWGLPTTAGRTGSPPASRSPTGSGPRCRSSPSTRRSSSRTLPGAPSVGPSRRRAIERPSGESSRIAVMGIIKAMPSNTMMTIHMDRILRTARPARHLIAECIEQAGAVADEERREREHAFLRLAPRIHGVPGAADLAQQRLALTLQARDQLLFDLLPAGQCRIARRLDRALERGIHRRDDPP